MKNSNFSTLVSILNLYSTHPLNCKYSNTPLASFDVLLRLNLKLNSHTSCQVWWQASDSLLAQCEIAPGRLHRVGHIVCFFKILQKPGSFQMFFLPKIETSHHQDARTNLKMFAEESACFDSPAGNPSSLWPSCLACPTDKAAGGSKVRLQTHWWYINIRWEAHMHGNVFSRTKRQQQGGSPSMVHLRSCISLDDRLFGGIFLK